MVRGGIYGYITAGEWKESRKEIIEAILATDMSMHFQLHDQVILQQFKRILKRQLF